jgi:hypothetical protein
MATAGQIKALVKEHIAGRWDESNHHGVDLRTCLVPPVKIPVILRGVVKGKIKDEIMQVWLVLEENPKTKDGYKIVFDEGRSLFGLASEGFPTDQHLVLTGFYGDFWTTFRGM